MPFTWATIASCPVPSDQTWSQLALPEGNDWYATDLGVEVYIVGDGDDEVVIQRLATLGA